MIRSYFFLALLVLLGSKYPSVLAQSTGVLHDSGAQFYPDSGYSAQLVSTDALADLPLVNQPEINRQFAHEFVLSYSHYPDSVLYPEDNYDLALADRRIDNEQITPNTWRWVSLEMEEASGQILTAYLRRPNWWIALNHAGQIGNICYLSLPEMGISGWSKVTGLYQSYVDTRVASFESEGNYCYRPIASRLNGECQGGTRGRCISSGP
jgi:hypothetical protein